MTNELEKQFFDTFGIECNISFHQQFNGAQVPRGLEFYKKREELAKTGIIKIWHKMLNPRPENDCVYWGEYHYPQITDRILLELILINMHNEDLFGYPTNIQELKDNTLKQLIETYNKFSTCITCDGEYQQTARDIKHQVRTLFEEG